MNYFCDYTANLGHHRFEYDYRRTSTEFFPVIYHAHQGIEFLFIHEGNGQLILEQKIIDIQPGMLILFQPFQLHHVRINVTPATPFVRTLCTFEPAAYEQYVTPFPLLASFFHYLWKDKLPTQIISGIGNDSALIHQFQHFHERIGVIKDENRMEEYALFILSILQCVHGLWNFNGSVSSGNERRMMNHAEQVMKWIEEHYTEKFELDRLAADLHLSKHHLCRTFQAATKNSIYDYLLARRIRQACWLLRTSEKTVQEIGLDVGYPSSSYFCKKFRQSTGQTPRQYRLAQQDQQLVYG